MAQKIKLYSTPACVYCKMARQYFIERGIPFEETDVSSSHAAAQEMMKKSGQMGVPVIEIDGQIVVGFDRAKIKELLAG